MMGFPPPRAAPGPASPWSATSPAIVLSPLSPEVVVTHHPVGADRRRAPISPVDRSKPIPSRGRKDLGEYAGKPIPFTGWCREANGRDQATRSDQEHR